MKTAVGYLRTNRDTEEGVQQVYTQHDLIEAFCKENNIECLGYFPDIGSGATFERPRFQLMLEQIESGKLKPDVILFTTWDRFSRNVFAALEMIKKLRRLNIKVKSIQDLGSNEIENLLTQILSKKKNEKGSKGSSPKQQ